MPALVVLVVVLALVTLGLAARRWREMPAGKPGATAVPAGEALPEAYDGFYPLVLRVGEMGTAHGVQVVLQAVEKDNRCPRLVQCAEAGVATVRVTITSPVPGARAIVKTLSIPGSRSASPPIELRGLTNRAWDAGATVYFVRLDPYPERPNEQIPASSYRATFAVRYDPE